MIDHISYKTLIGAKPLRIIFDKVDGFFGDYGEAKYLVLIYSEKYDAIFDRIRYILGLKSSISYVLLITMQKSRLIQMIISPQKKQWNQ